MMSCIIIVQLPFIDPKPQAIIAKYNADKVLSKCFGGGGEDELL